MFTDWNNTEENFYMFSRGWDILAAKKILRKKPRDTEDMEIEGLRSLLPKNGMGGILVDRKRVESGEGIDMDVPIILGHVEGNESDFHLPLDGWHRIARAFHLGLSTVPCVVLTKAETARIALK